MTDHELSRTVAEAAGWNFTSQPITPAFATSLDAIARLEQEAGLRVDVMWSNGECMAIAFLGDSSKCMSAEYDTTEARARCRAYLAARAAEKGIEQ